MDCFDYEIKTEQMRVGEIAEGGRQECSWLEVWQCISVQIVCWILQGVPDWDSDIGWDQMLECIFSK